MKKICFFSGDITRSGGTERVSTMIANALAQKKEYQVIFLSLVEQNRSVFFPLDNTISHFALGKQWISPGPAYLTVLPKLRHFLKVQHIDVLIDIDIVLDVLSIPASIGLPVKVIAWEHFNYTYETSISYRRFILNYITRWADEVVTLTKRDAVTFQKAFHRSQHIQAIYNPMEEITKIDHNFSHIPKENALITVGSLIPRKGVDYLAKVAIHLLPAHPDWKWYVVGDGEKKEYLKQKIKKYHLEEQVILTGQVKDVHPYLQKSKICVMTSRLEGLPMCLLEAKAKKLPIVSFHIPTGPDEIIEHGKNGYLIPAFDWKEMVRKLEKLMTEEALLQSFSNHSLDHIEKFQMEHILSAWCLLL